MYTIVVSASNVRTILAELTDDSMGIVTWYSPQDKLSLLQGQEPEVGVGAGAGAVAAAGAGEGTGAGVVAGVGAALDDSDSSPVASRIRVKYQNLVRKI